MVLWMGNSGCARPIGGLVWFGLVWFGVWCLAWLGGVAEWIGLALVWLVDIRDHGHARGSRRSELTII